MTEPVRIQIRYADIDVMGHVNNNVYSTYFEVARVESFGKALGQNWDWTRNGVVLAKNNIEFLRPVFLSDEVFVSVFVEEINTKSFTLSYELKVNNKIKTTGGSTLVCFDALKNETILIPEVMKETLMRMKRD